MSLPITPARLAATYACLRAFPPFNRLSLPPADQVIFKVTRSAKEHGHYNRYVGTDRHWIAISSRSWAHFDTLVWVVLPIGVGAGLGAMSAMWLHTRKGRRA